jgi:hypothetical protein
MDRRKFSCAMLAVTWFIIILTLYVLKPDVFRDPRIAVALMVHSVCIGLVRL